MKPLISIIIPTYNREKTIGRAIKSAVFQTYPNLEIIVVDDGSTDNSKNAVKQLKDKRIAYVSHKTNLGASAGRNTGVEKARGEYIAFLDSDDRWMLNKLEKQMAVFQKKTSTGVVYCRYYIVKGKRKEISSWPEISKYNGKLHEELLIGNFITSSSALLKKKILEKSAGFDTKLPAYQDWEFFLRVSKYANFAFVDEPLFYQYQDEKNRISESREKRIHAVRYILRKNQADIKKNRHIYARFLSMADYRLKAWLVEPENLRFLKEIIISISLSFLTACWRKKISF